jgi:hypothetical protein
MEDHRVLDSWRTAVAIREAAASGSSAPVEERFASTTCGRAGYHTVSGRNFPWCVCEG